MTFSDSKDAEGYDLRLLLQRCVQRQVSSSQTCKEQTCSSAIRHTSRTLSPTVCDNKPHETRPSKPPGSSLSDRDRSRYRVPDRPTYTTSVGESSSVCEI